jgi:hypothetical protein
MTKGEGLLARMRDNCEFWIIGDVYIVCEHKIGSPVNTCYHKQYASAACICTAAINNYCNGNFHVIERVELMRLTLQRTTAYFLHFTV